jgi:hypothetical protein
VSARATHRAILTVLFGLTLAADASAQQESRERRERHLALQVASACPSRAQVATELEPLLQGYALRADAPDLVATVEDLGESYRIGVAADSREVRDPARKCLERARVAAVFLALNLPPAGLAQPEPLPRPRPEPSRRGDEAAASPDLAARPDLAPVRKARAFEVRPFVLAEAASGAGVTSTGMGVGASLRFGTLAVSLLGALTTSTTPYQAAGQPPRFELQRLPFSLLLGWEASMGMLGLGAEAGPAVDVLRFGGKAVPNPERALRANLGLRLNAVVRVRASRRLAAELLPVISWFPRTYMVQVEPSHLLAETPRLWLGVTLGLSYQIWSG